MAVVVVLTLWSPPVAAAARQPNIDLNKFANVRIDGATAEGGLGTDVAGAGDVNGDGLPDLLVSSMNASYAGRPDAGTVNLVLGGRTLAPLDLGAPSGPLAARTITIGGPQPDDQLGVAVDGAGDVNHDGFDDMLLLGRVGGASGPATAYIIFGSATPT